MADIGFVIEELEYERDKAIAVVAHLKTLAKAKAPGLGSWTKTVEGYDEAIRILKEHTNGYRQAAPTAYAQFQHEEGERA